MLKLKPRALHETGCHRLPSQRRNRFWRRGHPPVRAVATNCISPAVNYGQVEQREMRSALPLAERLRANYHKIVEIHAFNSISALRGMVMGTVSQGK